jgi:hypothetical protein
MTDKVDPVIQAANLLVRFMQEDEIDPMVGMIAMMQLSAKIAYDSGVQDKLSEEDNRNRFMDGVMIAFDAAAGGTSGFETPKSKGGLIKGQRRHLSICPGVGKGSKKGIQHRRQRSKQARKTRRTNRGKR